MVSTLVIVCSRCGGFLLAKAGQKTRACPYCGYEINMARAKRVASAENAYEASEILKKLKGESSQKQKKVKHL